MYKRNKMDNGTLRISHQEEGEWLTEKVKRIMLNKEPITDGAPIQYTERKNGVMPEHDIRTDRFDLAIDAMNIATKGKIAERQLGIKKREEEQNPPKTDEPSQ